MAEAIFNEKVRQLGLEGKISGDSAGTANYHVGENPDHRTIKVATGHGVPIRHKGQQFRARHGLEFQYLVAMDQHNLDDMSRELGQPHDGLYLMRDFDPKGKGKAVPDPYHGSMSDFEEVYQILDRSLDEFIQFVRQKHGF